MSTLELALTIASTLGAGCVAGFGLAWQRRRLIEDRLAALEAAQKGTAAVLELRLVVIERALAAQVVVLTELRDAKLRRNGAAGGA